MIRVLVESPFAANENFTEEENIKYARECCNHCLMNSEAPYASHLFYTQEGLLDDNVEEERTLGINAGLMWGAVADKSVIYVDHGVSQGMRYGIEAAIKNGRPIEVRTLHGNNEMAQKIDRYIEEFKEKIGKDKSKNHTTTEKSNQLNHSPSR